MKVKRIILLVSVLLIVFGLVGCNTQAKKDETDAERLVIIEERIDDLFNEEKTDIINEFIQDDIDEIESLLEEEKDNEFSADNLKRIDSILMYLDLAIDMLALEQEVDHLFDEAGGLVKNAEIDTIETELVFFEPQTVFYERQLERMIDAKEQLIAIEEVQNKIDTLFINGEVKSDVTREQETEMRELVDTLKSVGAKRELEASLVKVATSLANQEKAVAIAQRQQEAERQRQLQAAEKAKAAEEKARKEAEEEAAKEEEEAGKEEEAAVKKEDEKKIAQDQEDEEVTEDEDDVDEGTDNEDTNDGDV